MSNSAEPAKPTSADRTGTNPLYQMVLARLREFVRQPEAVFWVYMFPLLMVIALGIAFRNKPIETFDVYIQEGPRAAAMLEVLENDEQKRFTAEIVDAETCQLHLRTGKIGLVVAGETEGDGLVFSFDPTRPGSIAAKETVDNVLQVNAGRQPVLATRDDPRSEPGGRYIDFLIPGLLGMGLMGGGLWGVGFAIVDMRIRKLLKRFLATPMKRSHFLAAAMISRLLFMIPEIILLIVFSRVFFGVVVFGSFGALVFLVILGAIQFSGVGLLVASRAKTMESVSGLMNLVMLPMWTLCGIFFSYERFPDAVQPLIKLLPLTPLIDALRAVMLEGSGLLELWPEIAVMVGWAVITFAIALKIFRWHD